MQFVACVPYTVMKPCVQLKCLYYQQERIRTLNLKLVEIRY